ncbi:hypothetical protein FACS189432_08750 [Bacteroidia bacterium]|nr:hypothetical protein FACS189426_10880 [Bacteroidia bacterium]GHT29590.1 hypothetical protein FACS189432_08750 [Bacteroidia bacterium]GHT86267.1 hypothetical protein FACS18947_5990 [Bacteroidia bacterium]
MKNKIFGGFAMLAIVAIATFNVSFNSLKSNNLTDILLANVEQLAMAEDLPEVVIECSYPSCHGKQCHQDIYNWVCPCEYNGYTYYFCAF